MAALAAGVVAAVGQWGCGAAAPVSPAGGGVATGIYLAATIDGVAVDDGESTLSLAPALVDQRATYSYTVRFAPSPLAESGVGTWAASGDGLTFRPLQGGASRTAAVGRGPGGVPEVAFTGQLGRAFTFRLARPDTATTRAVLVIAVVDSAGRQVGGATLAIRAPDGLVERFASSDHVPLPMQGPPGEWTVTTTPPAGYTLAPGHGAVVRATAHVVAPGVAPQDTARVVLARTAP